MPIKSIGAATISVLLLAGCGSKEQVKPEFGTWGFDSAGQDKSVKPGDSFFRYSDELETHPLGNAKNPGKIFEQFHIASFRSRRPFCAAPGDGIPPEGGARWPWKASAGGTPKLMTASSSFSLACAPSRSPALGQRPVADRVAPSARPARAACWARATARTPPAPCARAWSSRRAAGALGAREGPGLGRISFAHRIAHPPAGGAATGGWCREPAAGIALRQGAGLNRFPQPPPPLGVAPSAKLGTM